MADAMTMAAHVNSGPVEERYVFLKPPWTPGRQFGQAPPLDPTRCGGVPNYGSWTPLHPRREPEAEQIAAVAKWKGQTICADKVMTYCLRPPEFYDCLIDDFFEQTVCMPHKKPSQAEIVDWRSNGFFDLRGYGVKLRPSARFHYDFLVKLFSRLGAVDLLPTFVNELHAHSSDSHHNFEAHRWILNIVDIYAKDAVVVHPRFSPAQGAGWWVQKAIRQTVFADEEKLLVTHQEELRCHPPSAFNVVRDFALNHLRFWPIGYRGVFSNIEIAWSALRDNSTYDISWATSDADATAIHEKEFEEKQKLQQERHENMFQFLAPWGRGEGQTDESWQEQQSAMDCLLRHIQPFVDHTCI